MSSLSGAHFPHNPTPLGHHRALSWAPCVIYCSFPLAIYFIHGSVHVSTLRLQCGGPGFNPWVGKVCWRRERLPTPLFWPGEFQGLHGVVKSQTGLSNFHFHFSCDPPSSDSTLFDFVFRILSQSSFLIDSGDLYRFSRLRLSFMGCSLTEALKESHIIVIGEFNIILELRT